VFLFLPFLDNVFLVVFPLFSLFSVFFRFWFFSFLHFSFLMFISFAVLFLFCLLSVCSVSGFFFVAHSCVANCGDGIVVGNEECDGQPGKLKGMEGGRMEGGEWGMEEVVVLFLSF
jgi:hypothetical protein